MSEFEPPQSRKPDSSKFREGKFTYHQEIEVEIASLTNLGEGVARVDGWVVFIAGALAGEKIVARIWHNAANFSRGDLVRVVVPSPHRVQPRCDLFGECGGCQYQNLAYPQQLEWKQKQVAEAFERLGGIKTKVDACHPSPKQYGYRSKITPHFMTPPRKGCDEAFLDQLHAFGPRRIVYVSCAPDTQARDVKYLCAKGWKVISVRPFDLFPQTRHVECIAALERA